MGGPHRHALDVIRPAPVAFAASFVKPAAAAVRDLSGFLHQVRRTLSLAGQIIPLQLEWNRVAISGSRETKETEIVYSTALFAYHHCNVDALHIPGYRPASTRRPHRLYGNHALAQSRTYP